MPDRAMARDSEGTGFSDELLDEAERIIRARGYEHLDARDVVAASESGPSGADPPSEWELFSAVVRRDEQRFNERLDAATAGAAAGRAELLALLEACAIEHDWALWIELLSLSLRDGRARALRAELGPALRERLAAAIERGIAAGEFGPAKPEATVSAIDGLIDGLAIDATFNDPTVTRHFMLDASAGAAGCLVGAALKLPRADG